MATFEHVTSAVDVQQRDMKPQDATIQDAIGFLHDLVARSSQNSYQHAICAAHSVGVHDAESPPHFEHILHAAQLGQNSAVHSADFRRWDAAQLCHLQVAVRRLTWKNWALSLKLRSASIRWPRR